MLLKSTTPARSNLSIVVRERGKIVTRREGHNIWLNVGRTWLTSLITCTSFTPITPETDFRAQYMGLGIGGSRQNAPAVANNPPCSTHYPGTNLQLDDDPKLLQLERPVRIGWAVGPGTPSGTYPNLTYDPGDIWLKQIQAPPTHTPLSMTRIVTLFDTGDITAGPFLQVPVAEIGLFHGGANVNLWNNSPVAYDTFDSIPKTGSLTITVTWTIRF